MRVNIKNVGVIQDSELELNGLTVITGQNNSGKTTVGKIIYSIFSSKENLYENATADIIKFSKRQITDYIRNSGLSFFFRRYRINVVENKSDNNILLNVYKGEYPEITSIEDMQKFILSICEEIELLELNEISNLDKRDNRIISKYRNEEEFKNEMFELIEQLNKLIKVIAQLSDFDFYEKTKILKIMKKEFNNQISPVKLPENYISIISLNDEHEYYQVKIDNKLKKITTDGYLGFDSIGNVIFIDDITVIDNASPSFEKFYRLPDFYRTSDLSDAIMALEHKVSLICKLSKTNDIVESIVGNSYLENVYGKINDVLSDHIVVRDGSFVCSADDLDIANLAMGSKMFAILQMLITNGSINDKTLLVLDEPEAHLHPLWQNKLAEILILIMKEIGVKTIITSHSPNFVLALQTYALKYKVVECCDFYSTQKRSDGYTVDYKKMNNELSKIYAEFAAPFSYMKAVFDSLVDGENDG